MELLHRDDLPKDILDKLAEKFPGMKIVCAGDTPGAELPPEVAKMLKAVNEGHEKSLATGTCVDCGAPMPTMPKPEDPIPEDWQPPKGWAWLMDGEEISAWICPTCDKAEGDGPVFKNLDGYSKEQP